MKSRHARSGSGGKHGRAGKAAASPVAPVTLALLFLLPIFFTPKQLLEEFEFTKVTVLVTGALILFAWWIAAESSRIASAGFPGWIRALPGRVIAAIRRDPLGGAVALMLISAAASTLGSVRPPLSLFGATQSHAGFRTVAALAAVYYASRSLASNPGWIRRVAQAAGLGAAIAAAYSLLQLLKLDPITYQRQISFEGIARSGSTFGHPNTLSAYLVTCVPLVLWLAARSRARAARIAWLALAAVSLFLVVTSLSRGAWLGAGAAGLAAATLALVSRRIPSRAWAIGGPVLLLALLIPLATPLRGPVLTRLSQITDLTAETSRTRVELWRAGLRMFADHPILGAGVDAYLAAFPRYRTVTLTRIEWGGTPGKAHNDAIQILATQGTLGGLAALAIVALCAAGLWRVARRGNPESQGVAIAVGAALAAYAASSLVGFATAATSALAAALAGWIGRTARTTEAVPDAGAAGVPGALRPGPGPPVRSFLNLAAGLALAAVLWFFLVGKPLRAEMYLAQALRHSHGTPRRQEFLEQAAETAPWDPRYSAELGRSYFYAALQSGDDETRLRLLAEARDALEKSVRTAPENSENRILYATILSGQSVLQPDSSPKSGVRDEFKRAVELDPVSPIVLLGAERGLMAAGLLGDAREIALRCARSYPDYAPPLADLGSMALEEGRDAAAADTLRLALGRKWREDVTGASNTWNNLAKATLALRDYPQALAAADSALARDPNLVQAYALKAAAERAMGKTQADTTTGPGG